MKDKSREKYYNKKYSYRWRRLIREGCLTLIAYNLENIYISRILESINKSSNKALK